MNSVINEKVLVLNRLWQPICETNVAVAFADLFRGVACAIDTCSPMRAVTIHEWLTLPIREGDHTIQTTRGPVRVPSVIVKGSYSRMPIRRPRLDRRSIAERDGFRCQYSGEKILRGTIDHVVPVSKGGARKSWKNMVWCSPELNAKKGNKLNAEIGLKLIKPPVEPKPLPVCVLIKRRPDKPEWDSFLVS